MLTQGCRDFPPGFGVRQPSGAFPASGGIPRSKAAEGCRSPGRYRAFSKLIYSSRLCFLAPLR